MREFNEGDSRVEERGMKRSDFMRLIDEELLKMSDRHQDWNALETTLSTRDAYNAFLHLGTKKDAPSFADWQKIVNAISLKIQTLVRRSGVAEAKRVFATVRTYEDVMRLDAISPSVR